MSQSRQVQEGEGRGFKAEKAAAKWKSLVNAG